MRRPPLYRLWRLFGLVATLVVVIVIVVTAIAVASLFQTARGLASSANPNTVNPFQQLTTSLVGDTLVNELSVPVDNHGYFAIENVAFSGFVVNGTNGTVPIGQITGQPATIPAGAQGNLTVAFPVNLSGPGGEFLATHNTTLGTHLWINWSYAVLYGFSLRFGFSYPWGPPFGNLTYTLQAVTAQSNGTNEGQLVLSFVNAAGLLNLSGALHATLRDGSGTTCGSATFPIVGPAGLFSAREPVWMPSSCPTAGLSVESVYVAPSGPLVLPTEGLR